MSTNEKKIQLLQNVECETRVDNDGTVESVIGEKVIYLDFKSDPDCFLKSCIKILEKDEKTIMDEVVSKELAAKIDLKNRINTLKNKQKNPQRLSKEKTLKQVNKLCELVEKNKGFMNMLNESKLPMLQELNRQIRDLKVV